MNDNLDNHINTDLNGLRAAQGIANGCLLSLVGWLLIGVAAVVFCRCF